MTAYYTDSYGIQFTMSGWLFTPRAETRRTNRYALRSPARLYRMDTGRSARSRMTLRNGMHAMGVRVIGMRVVTARTAAPV